MATDAEILSVRKDARLHGHEYFDNQTGSKLEMIKQQPPITIINVYKNKGLVTETADYVFDDYRTLSLTADAVENDVYHVEWGSTVTNAEIEDIIDFSKEELYSCLRLYYNDSQLNTSTYVGELYLKLAAGYLIMAYWEGYARGEDFWKMGRNWVDLVHKRCDQIKSADKQLVDGSGDIMDKARSPFQYKVLEYQEGLVPSEIYSQHGDLDTDEEVY